MSRIEINNGGGTAISGITNTTSSVAIKQPSINVSIGGIIGGDAAFSFLQDSPSNTWTINHNLNKHPSVTVVDSGQNVVYGEVQYTDTNNLTVSFNATFSGNAYLN